MRFWSRSLRQIIREYARLWAKANGHKGVGSRVYGMLPKHGVIETLRRSVSKPTDGLDFLRRHGRLNLSAERLALDPRFADIIPEDIRAFAKARIGG
jgi:hypothetical protein